MKNIKSDILINQEISRDFYYLKLKVPSSTPAKPGQFLTMRVSECTTPLLRRPFAYCGFNKEDETVEMIYQKKGPTTDILANKNPGETVDLLGPLGNAFPLPGRDKVMKNHKGVILVTGGVGLGPILFMAHHCKKENIPFTMVSGFRTAEFVPCEKYLLNETVVCTDDGSCGFSGNVVQYLDTIDKSNIENYAVLSCGPLPMMKAINSWAEKNKLDSWVSMEEMMGCGVGACMGCMVQTNDEKGTARVCVEGPVFKSEVIKWS